MITPEQVPGKMRKILILGGAFFQIPVINYAKSQGHYVITCDYLPDNPGHKLANEYHNVSTTDKEGVLELAKELRIDGVLAFASDPAALTAAFVAEKMSLPGNSFKAVQILSEKDLFREYLSVNGFNCPFFKSYDNLQSFMENLGSIKFPIVIKPVDSSGTKGVSRADGNNNLELLFNIAMEFSRCKRVIIEEYIDGHQFHGDAFVNHSKIVFACLGDHYFNGTFNSSTMYPSKYPPFIIEQMLEEVNKFLYLVGFQHGGINIEIRLSVKDNKAYILEIGPRNGGHFTPDLIHYASGFDFVKASVDACLGEAFIEQKTLVKGYFTNLVLYSQKPGVYKNVVVSPELEKHILEKHFYKKPGDLLLSGTTSISAVGTLLLKFDSYNQMFFHVDHAHDYYRVELG
jgi:carbamoylphosphate synthase large subunit